MLCFLCGKKIGLLRSLADQQYCSSEHRKEARMASSTALRDEDDAEPWSVSNKTKRRPTRSGASAGHAASTFAFLTVGGLLVAAVMMPAPGPGTAFPSVSLDPGVKRGLFQRVSDSISDVVSSRAPVTLHQDFTSGWSGWTTSAMTAVASRTDSRIPSVSAPTLRLWSRSTTLQNYQMEFGGQIEKKSLSWAFRATDTKNYYATKILITKPGSLPNAGLLRYVVLNGRETDRVQLPLPLTLERGGNYKVRVSVRDDHFITYLNNQVISSWSDNRLPRGGVGFFDDADDPQKVAWINLSERDSLLGRVLAHFALFVLPSSIDYLR